jgi:hemolysin E
MDAKATADIISKGLTTAQAALDVYNKTIDQVIPWKTFDDAIAELLRYQDEYSEQAAALVAGIKTLLLNSRDAYYSATQSVYEWCGVTSQLLAAYLTLFDDYCEKKADAQKAILLKTLGDGITKMTAAKDQLEKSSGSFNSAAGNLITLQIQFNTDFDSKSAYFSKQVNKVRAEAYGGAAAGVVLGPFGLIISYAVAAGIVEGKLIPELEQKFGEVKTYFQNLKDTVTQAGTDIEDAKTKLQTEISAIGEMLIKTNTTSLYVTFDDLMVSLLKHEAQILIDLCNEYQKRHGKKAAVSS